MARFVEVHDHYDSNWINVSMVQRVAQLETDKDGVSECKVELTGGHTHSIFSGEDQVYSFEKASDIAADLRAVFKSAEVRVYGVETPVVIDGSRISMVNANMGGYRLYMVGGRTYDIQVGGDGEYSWDEATALIAGLIGGDFEVERLRREVSRLEADDKRLTKGRSADVAKKARYEAVQADLVSIRSDIETLRKEVESISRELKEKVSKVARQVAGHECSINFLNSRLTKVEDRVYPDDGDETGNVRNEHGDC